MRFVVDGLDRALTIGGALDRYRADLLDIAPALDDEQAEALIAEPNAAFEGRYRVDFRDVAGNTLGETEPMVAACDDTVTARLSI